MSDCWYCENPGYAFTGKAEGQPMCALHRSSHENMKSVFERFGVTSNEGEANQAQWQTEDGWIVSYTTSRIEGGRNHGKFAVMLYKPTGKGARTGKASEWTRTYMRAFSTRKAARKRAEQLYYQHSPKTAERHGVAS